MKRFGLLTLVALSLTAVLTIVLTAFSIYLEAPLDRSFFLLQLTFVVILGWWLAADAARRKITLGMGSVLAAIACFPVFFIFYCFHSRGRRGWALCLGGLAALSVYALLAFLAALLATGFN